MSRRHRCRGALWVVIALAVVLAALATAPSARVAAARRPIAPTPVPTVSMPVPDGPPAAQPAADNGCLISFPGLGCVINPANIQTFIAAMAQAVAKALATALITAINDVAKLIAPILTGTPNFADAGQWGALNAFFGAMQTLALTLWTAFFLLAVLRYWLTAIGADHFDNAFGAVRRGVGGMILLLLLPHALGLWFLVVNGVTGEINGAAMINPANPTAGQVFGVIAGLLLVLLVDIVSLVALLAVGIIRIGGLFLLASFYAMAPVCVACWVSPDFKRIGIWWFENFVGYSLWGIGYAVAFKVIAVLATAPPQLLPATAGLHAELAAVGTILLKPLISLAGLLVLLQVPRIVGSAMGGAVHGDAGGALGSMGSQWVKGQFKKRDQDGPEKPSNVEDGQAGEKAAGAGRTAAYTYIGGNRAYAGRLQSPSNEQTALFLPSFSSDDDTQKIPAATAATAATAGDDTQILGTADKSADSIAKTNTQIPDGVSNPAADIPTQDLSGVANNGIAGADTVPLAARNATRVLGGMNNATAATAVAAGGATRILGGMNDGGDHEDEQRSVPFENDGVDFKAANVATQHLPGDADNADNANNTAGSTTGTSAGFPAALGPKVSVPRGDERTGAEGATSTGAGEYAIEQPFGPVPESPRAPGMTQSMAAAASEMPVYTEGAIAVAEEAGSVPLSSGSPATSSVVSPVESTGSPGTYTPLGQESGGSADSSAPYQSYTDTAPGSSTLALDAGPPLGSASSTIGSAPLPIEHPSFGRLPGGSSPSPAPPGQYGSFGTEPINGDPAAPNGGPGGSTSYGPLSDAGARPRTGNNESSGNTYESGDEHS